jgi:hypothetical protein
MVIEVDDVESAYRGTVDNGLPTQKEPSRQTWGHNSFCVKEPNGLTLYLHPFRERRWKQPGPRWR